MFAFLAYESPAVFAVTAVAPVSPPGAACLASAFADRSAGAFVPVAAARVAQPGAASGVVVFVDEAAAVCGSCQLWVVFAAAVSDAPLSPADVAEPQVSDGIHLSIDFSVPPIRGDDGVDSSEYPSFSAFPSIGSCARYPSSVEAANMESAHSPIGTRANCGLCSTSSNRGPH